MSPETHRTLAVMAVGIGIFAFIYNQYQKMLLEPGKLLKPKSTDSKGYNANIEQSEEWKCPSNGANGRPLSYVHYNQHLEVDDKSNEKSPQSDDESSFQFKRRNTIKRTFGLVG